LSNYKNEKFELVLADTKRKKEGLLDICWKVIDSTTKIKKAIKLIDKLFQKPGIGSKLNMAARSSMEKVVCIFKEKFSLDFTELSIISMMGLKKFPSSQEEMLHNLIYRYNLPSNILSYSKIEIAKIMAKREDSNSNFLSLSDIGSTLHQQILTGLLESDDNVKGKFKKLLNEFKPEEQRGYLCTYPIHWAAITGNLIAVRYLKSISGKDKEWIRSIDLLGEVSLSPLHCAIRYCADNGEDLELIKELSTKKNVLRTIHGHHTDPLVRFIGPWTEKMVWRESPLLQALEELYLYPKTIKYFLDIAEIEQSEKEELLRLIILMKDDDVEQFGPKRILTFAINHQFSPEIIKFLISLGAEFKNCDDDIDRSSPFSAVIVGRSNKHYSEQEDRLALFDVLAEAGYNLHLKDFQNLTPLQYALQEGDLVIIEKLIEHGESLDVKQRKIMKQLKHNPQKVIRQSEPVRREKPLISNDEFIHKIRINSKILPEEKDKVIQKMEKANESSYYYDDGCTGVQWKLAEKACRKEGGYNTEEEFDDMVLGKFAFSNKIEVEMPPLNPSKWPLFSKVRGRSVDTQYYDLGVLKFLGISSPRDLESAVELFTLSANLKNPSAQYRLGHCKLHGFGTPEDIEGAINLLTLSADQGNASALYLLGYCKLKGVGTPEELQVQ
jgi:ankyrin repeat protein